MSNESLKIGATMELEVVNSKGEIIDRRTKHNLVVNGGYDLISNLIALQSGRPNYLSHIGVGTGTTAPALTDTALGTEWGSRVGITYTHTAGTATFTMSCTIPAHTGSMVAITESGIFNAATSGTMFNRVTFTAVNKEAADTINIRYIVNLTNS